MLGRAVTTGRLEVGLENPRSHADDPHRTVDDRPFGGGPGMVLKAEPLARAVAAAKARLPAGAPVIGLVRAGPAVRPGRGAAARGPAGLRAGGRALRGHRPARVGRADRRGTVDRRLCAVGRRVPGAHRDRRGRAAPAGRAGRRGLGRRRIRSATGCSTGRITRGRKCGTAGRCRRCCSAATTPPSGAGG